MLASKMPVTRKLLRPHVLFFSNHLRGPHGSAGARSWHQVKHMSEVFSVTVILPEIDPVTAQLVTHETYAGLADNVDVHKVPVSSNDRSSISRRILYYLSAIPKQTYLGFRVRKPDVVLTMSLPLTTLAIAWCVSLLRRAHLVVDVRDLPFEMAEEVGYIKNVFALKILRAIETFLLKRADAILTNSPRYKPALIERGIPEKKIEVALIGYDNFAEPSIETVKLWRKNLMSNLRPETEIIGVYVGTMGYAVPVEELLAGANELAHDKRFGFVFLGDGQRLQQFRTFARENNLNASFLARVNKREVMAICRAANFCMYSAAHGRFSGAMLGNKVFDYLGAGKPVLYVGGDSAVRDLLLDLGAGVTVGVGKPDDFAAAARRMMEDPEEVRLLQDGARELFTRGHTAEASAHKLVRTISAFVFPCEDL
jgi:glycosyltransferase involved in cell wall biosynthesis